MTKRLSATLLLAVLIIVPLAWHFGWIALAYHLITPRIVQSGEKEISNGLGLSD